MLHEYSLVKSAFINFNTMIPSSATVERLFSSVGGQTETARWNRLSDTNFENFCLKLVPLIFEILNIDCGVYFDSIIIT